MMSYDEYLDAVVKELQKIVPEKEYKLEVIAGEKQITTRGITSSSKRYPSDGVISFT